MMLSDADSRSLTLIAKPTSGKPLLLANGREFFKCWDILEEIRLQRIVLLWINRFLRILKIYIYTHTYIHTYMITALFHVATTQKNASTTQQSPPMATAFALMLSVEMYCGKTAHAPISDECKQNSILNREFQTSLEAGNRKFSSFVTKK